MIPLNDPKAARQEEIRKVLAVLETRKRKLIAFIESGITPEDLARVKAANDDWPGYLSELWSRFMAMPPRDQISSLSQEKFEGMHWQSLMQSCPYVYTSGWKDVK